MDTTILNTAITNIESTITKLYELQDNKKISKIINSLESIESELYDLLNAEVHKFDRTKELKTLLDTALRLESIGYDSALQIFKESNLNSLLSYQFDYGYYTLSNGERIGKDFRIIMYHYLHS